MKLKTLLFVCLSPICLAQTEIKLFEGKAPGYESKNYAEGSFPEPQTGNKLLYNVTDPSITVYLPKKEVATGTAVVIIPGGAFHILSINSEGNEVAQYLNSKGIAAFVLKHRLIEVKTSDIRKEIGEKMSKPTQFAAEVKEFLPFAIQDAQTAIDYVRANAEKFDIDINKVGIMGFSAGGTIALAEMYAANNQNRPNFIAPIYPYVDATDYAKNIPTQNTPIFIAVAANDPLGFAPTCQKLFNDWKSAGNDAEIHIYEQGGHGFGMNKNHLPSDKWAERFTDWLKMHKYLEPKHPLPWNVGLTEEEIEARENANREKTRKDWANLERYKTANVKLKKQPKVVFIGDSITDGWPYQDSTYFISNNFVGRGISGQTSPQTLLRFQQDVIALKPQAVVINIGINDIAENTGDYSEKYTLGNYESMIAVAKANNIKVILASVLPANSFPWRKEITNVPEKVIALNNGIKKLALKHKVNYLDYFTNLKDSKNGLSQDMAEDGVHPTLKCYKIMESLALKAIQLTTK